MEQRLSNHIFVALFNKVSSVSLTQYDDSHSKRTYDPDENFKRRITTVKYDVLTCLLESTNLSQ